MAGVRARQPGAMAGSRRRTPTTSLIAPRHLAAGALVLVLSGAGFVAARALVERDAREDSEQRVEIAAAQIRGRLEQATALTYSMGAFMVSEGTDGVTNDEFARVALRWLLPAGIQSAAWAEIVRATDRARYERHLGQAILRAGVPREVAPRASVYLPATLVSTFPPLNVRGLDLRREPGIVAALASAIRPGGVGVTPIAARKDGTNGLFIVAPAPNLVDGALRPGFVALFVSETTLRAAARNAPQVRVRTGGAGGSDTVHEEFTVAGGQFSVSIPKESPSGPSALLPWLVLLGGVVLALLAVSLGPNAVRRAKAQADLDRLFNLSSDLIAVQDFDGRFMRVNPAAEAILGYSEEELLERPSLDFVHPDDRAKTAAEIAKLSEGVTTLSFENRYVRKDGSERVLEWTATAVVPDGLMYGVARDMTERRQTEQEQQALRRIATLVADGIKPNEVFTAVTEAIGPLLGADLAAMHVFPGNGTAKVIAGWSAAGPMLPIGSRLPLDGDSAVGRIARTGAAARMDTYEQVEGETAEVARDLRLRSTVGAPIVVEGKLWGALMAATRGAEPLADDAEIRVAAFTELVATAIANAESRSELAASRRRIVAASDDARRRIERDLHDGVQQQLVSLSMALGSRAEELPAGDALREELANVSQDLASILDRLVEIARGIHPAILTQGGLAPALRTLARRSVVPVDLDARIDVELPDDVEVAAYYVVSEALTNVAKHAFASAVVVDVRTDDGTLTLAVRDDGVGGAALGHGSGLVGLQDRVEALGGRIMVESSPERGTSVVVQLPISSGSGVGKNVLGARAGPQPAGPR